ncbi:MAG: hypothetical protein ABI378_00425 [Chitinophagaceae bacterium]
MKYTIENIHHKPHDLDADVVFFDFEIHFEEPEVAAIPYFLDMSTLKKYLRATQPAFYKFYEDTRNSLDLFGPAEMQTLEALGEEGLNQLYDYLEEYLMTCDWVPKMFADAKAQRDRPVKEQYEAQEKVEEIFADLSDAASGMVDSTARSRQFCNEATRILRETALRIYPEIAELEPVVIKEFKDFFVGDVLRMAKRIEEMLG